MPAPNSSFFSKQAYAAPSLLVSLVFLWFAVVWLPDCDLLSYNINNSSMQYHDDNFYFTQISLLILLQATLVSQKVTEKI